MFFSGELKKISGCGSRDIRYAF